MAGKRSRPVIGKLAGSLMFGNRTAAAVVTSPRSPLEYTNAIQVQSPTKGSNKYDAAAGGGVGLAIVAALDKSGGAACSPCLNRSDLIPVNANCGRLVRGGHDTEAYTCVTRRRGGPSQSIARVYCEDGGIGYDRRRECAEQPPRFAEDRLFPSSDFLSACNWCRKKLHGRDIYMYRGEKAFCSNECRCRQITIDERKEQCGSEASRYADVSSSPCGATGQIFSAGIVAV